MEKRDEDDEEKGKELDKLVPKSDEVVQDVKQIEEVVVERPSRLHEYSGLLLGLLSAFFLSMSNVFVKKAQLFSGTEQTAVRYTMQGILMLAIAWHKGLNLLGERGNRKMLVLRGVFGTFGLTTLHLAVKFINPSDAVALFHTNVIIVALIARFTLNEKFSIIHILAVFMAITGIYYIFNIR